MTTLVTGVNGFVGKHLVRELKNQGIKVIGIGFLEKEADEDITKLLNEYYQCDITAPQQVEALPLTEIDSVINLAGLADVGASYKNPELYMSVNVKVLKVLGDKLYSANPKAKMIAISTGALYDPNQTMPLTEGSEIVKNGSPYVLSKIAMEKEAANFKSNGYDCVVVRPFNHIGPGQGSGFLIPDLANKLRSTNKENPVIVAGNLNTTRDYSDVRDIARAYTKLATTNKLKHDLYNVCSGSGHTGRDIVKVLCEALGVDFKKLSIEVDESLLRPHDSPKIIGDCSRLKNDTGWSPTISLKKTIEDIAD